MLRSLVYIAILSSRLIRPHDCMNRRALASSARIRCSSFVVTDVVAGGACCPIGMEMKKLSLDGSGPEVFQSSGAARPTHLRRPPPAQAQ